MFVKLSMRGQHDCCYFFIIIITIHKHSCQLFFASSFSAQSHLNSFSLHHMYCSNVNEFRTKILLCATIQLCFLKKTEELPTMHNHEYFKLDMV